jgi:type II secretory pathway pseudopilin PulG
MTTRRCRRPAYTLLELILVAAVLAMIGAIVYPSLKGMYGYYKVNGAVDTIRAAWASARARAIEEGQPYRFAVISGTGKYRVAPDSDSGWGDSSTASSSNSSTGSNHTPPLILEATLPEGVAFSGDGSVPLSGGMPAPAAPPTGGGGGYGPGIVFLPDGTARADARLDFQVRGALPMTLSLRGLTGAVTVKTGKAASNPGGR